MSKLHSSASILGLSLSPKRSLSSDISLSWQADWAEATARYRELRAAAASVAAMPALSVETVRGVQALIAAQAEGAANASCHLTLHKVEGP